MEDSQEREAFKREVAEIDIVGGKTNKQGFVLIPQPSNDPNEPLVRRLCSDRSVIPFSDDSTELAAARKV